MIKRAFDFVCALLGIIGTSPLWVIAIVGILVSDWGPIFYVATRIGKDNRPFKMYKFRSMRVASPQPSPEGEGDGNASEASLRPEQDRIFAFGHFIRAAKIDELPQLLNILNGTMSVIGPRPVAQDQFDMFRYGKWDEAKTVPVGLSGPAALYDYIYGDQFTDETEYMAKVYPTRRELEYTYVLHVRRGSLHAMWYDVKMIIYTVICICYSLCGKECKWILRELLADAKAADPQLDVMPKM